MAEFIIEREAKVYFSQRIEAESLKEAVQIANEIAHWELTEYSTYSPDFTNNYWAQDEDGDTFISEDGETFRSAK
jgi:hypothetical protein